jgi:hypothetical protein
MTTHNHQIAALSGKSVQYEAEYGQYINLAAEAMKKKFEYDWTQEDTIAFGQYADTWQQYRPVMESDTTTQANLGEAIKSNLGLVAMAYASLPIQNLASVQPLADEAGTVYFRKGIAQNTRGGVAAGDVLINPLGGINESIDKYTSETQTASVAIASTATLTYNVALGEEVRPGAIRINVGGGKVKAMDDGEGHIVGVGIDSDASSVNYATGAAVIVFTDLAGKGVANGDILDVLYHQSTVAADTIPTMKWILQNQVIQADYYVLQSQYSNISEMVLRKRFGADLSDQIAGDLVAQVTSSVMFGAIRKLRTAALRNEQKTGVSITWPMVAPTGVSDADHRRTFDDKLIEAVGQMYAIAGKGEVSTIVVGTKGKQVLRTAGMRIIKNAVSGPHLCGMYDSVPVYYAPGTVLGDNEMLVIYRGSNWYEAPLVYAPFLPVTSVAGRATDNVLTNAQAVYHAAGLESVMDGFVVRISLV